MRVLMLGWEFPPFITGGLGTACHGLAQAISNRQTHILFVLPRNVELPAEEGTPRSKDGGTLLLREAPGNAPAPQPASAGDAVELARIPADLPDPYGVAPRRSSSPARSAPDLESRRLHQTDGTLHVAGAGLAGGYETDLMDQVDHYARRCAELLKYEDFDIIHAHDWITYPAAIRLSQATGKPIIAHIHATEFDRSGEFVNAAVYGIERQGMMQAARVVAVSARTRNFVVERYGIPGERVEVIHNGIEIPAVDSASRARVAGENPTVLFLGRMTMQKGPQYFVEAARLVVGEIAGARFVMVGAGDLLPKIRDMVRESGLEERFEFPGFLRGDAVQDAYRNADVYVMPSVSEPFGLTALEAAGQGTPVILSKSSGVAEVLKHGALQVDFWDTPLMARLTCALLRHRGLAEHLSHEGVEEVKRLTWDVAADLCLAVYHGHMPTATPVRAPHAGRETGPSAKRNKPVGRFAALAKRMPKRRAGPLSAPAQPH